MPGNQKKGGSLNEVTISLPEIQILLNLMDEISVMYPFYRHFTLFTVKQDEDGYAVKVLQGQKDFEDQQSHFTFSEMPSYTDFVQCLLAAGIIHYENIAEFEERVKAYSSISKPVLFSPDTNVLYHRFLANSEMDLRSVLLVSTVREEIEASLNFKYSPEQISKMKGESGISLPAR